MLKLWFYGGIPLCFTGLLPSIIAHAREHPRKTTIFWINVLLSATGFGWLLAMGLAIGLIQPEWDKRLDPVSETDSTSETVSISVADELEKLVAMKEKGLLTDQEFSDAKEKLLS